MSELPQNLPHVIQVAAPFINKHGYEGVVGLLFLESMGLPVPGETTLITAALFASIGHLNIFVVIILALLAAVIGDNIAYLIGRLGGSVLIEKYGKYIFIPPERFKKIEDYMRRNGGKVVIVARFIDGLRQLNGIIAGSTEMPWPKFLTFNLIGALIWVLFWTGLGYYSGAHINTLLKFQLYISIVAVILIVAFIVYKIYKKVKKDKSTA